MMPTPFVPMLLTMLLGMAAPHAQATSAPPPQTSFKASKTDGYRPVAPALRAYLQSQPRQAKGQQQHFCVIGYEMPPQGDAKASRTAWVHWVEGQRLIQWSPAAEGFQSADTLLHSTRELDLKKDVVPNADSINGSTYLVDRKWVDNLQRDCRLRGERFQLRSR